MCPSRHWLAVALPCLAAVACITPLPSQAHDAGHPAVVRSIDARPVQTDWGRPGQRGQATRTIVVRMTDAMRFVPDQVAVRQGETVRFVVHNDGRLMHELVLGTPDALKAHAADMARNPTMDHEGPGMVHVLPGAQAEMTWTFNRSGRFAFACLVPGHAEAGMTGRIAVDGDAPADAPARNGTGTHVH